MKATYRTIKSAGRTGKVTRKAAAKAVSKVMAAKAVRAAAAQRQIRSR